MVQKGTVGTFAGTDAGICAKLFPQTFDSAHQIPMRNRAILEKIDSEPGVKNGINNGMTLMLDAEVFDYIDRRRYAKKSTGRLKNRRVGTEEKAY